jgi:hypothetical protein
MSKPIVVSALTLLTVCLSCQIVAARMAPKYERVSFLGAALDRLSEISGLLEEPIEKIEVRGDQVYFVAGRCSVAVAVAENSAPWPPMTPGRGTYRAQVGARVCN